MFMVKEATLRKRKYVVNIDPETLKKQITAVKPLMVTKETAYFSQIAEVERKVKVVCEEAGITTFQVAQYINFGRQLYRLTNKFSGSTLLTEACATATLWSTRGLNNTLLLKVLALFGLSCSNLPQPSPSGLGLIESVILDNSEQSTTYNDTGDTGLLLGTVKLPTPLNQMEVAFLLLSSHECRFDQPEEIDIGNLILRFSDGIRPEYDQVLSLVGSYTYIILQFNGMWYSYASMPNSLKGNTNLELRLYLMGSPASPNIKVLCRNLVVTVLPLYKS
jgi:hypothetical protein